MSSATDLPSASSLLRTQRAVAAVLGAGAARQEPIAALLPAMGEALAWAAASLWEPHDADAAQLVCTGVWCAPSCDGRAWMRSRRARVLGAGEGLPGSVFASGRPAWTCAGAPGAGERRTAARGAPDWTVCFALLGARDIGVIEVLVRRSDEPDAELLETVAALGGQIGQYAERRRAEADLRRSDALMRATLDVAFDAIVTMDAEGMIVGANPAAEELFGRPAWELVGHELAATIIPPSLRDAHREGLARYVTHGAQRVVGHPVELTAMRADGTEFPVEVAIRRLEIPGPPVFTGFIRDLTARRAAEEEVRLLAEEQAALRRVATLVARSADTGAVFAAVTEEVARLSGAETANMIRYQRDDTAVVIGEWSDGSAPSVPLGTIVPLDGDSAGPRIRRTGAPVRVDSFVPGPGRLAESLSRLGFTAAVGAPVVVDDDLWGAVIVRSARGPFPDGAEYRLQAFAELAGQALANADAREQLAASRARIVTAGMEERRRLERNLHDGAQQRLVSLALMLRMAAQYVDRDPGRVRSELARAGDELARALSELREIARGLHPAVLGDRGLEAAVRSLCGGAPVPVDVEVELEARPADAIQAAAYYVVAEALTNVAKYANATAAHVELRARDGVLHVDVSDDGVGGADRDRGSGLSGLTDRVEALGGRLAVDSPLGRGTRIRADLPL